ALVLVLDALDREADVLGGELAVPLMPLHAFAELESPGLLVRADFPALGECGTEIRILDLAVGECEQALVDRADHRKLADADRDMRIDGPDIVDTDGDAQRLVGREFLRTGVAA